MRAINEEMLDLTALYPSLRWDSGKSDSAISSSVISAQWQIVKSANTVSKSRISCRFIMNSNVCTNKSSTREYKHNIIHLSSKTDLNYQNFLNLRLKVPFTVLFRSLSAFVSARFALITICHCADTTLDEIAECDLPESSLRDGYRAVRSSISSLMALIEQYRDSKTDMFLSACED